MSGPLLEVRDLGVRVATTSGPRALLEGVSFMLQRGERVGVVGASGAGKSTLGSALVRLLPRAATYAPGSVVRLNGDDLLGLTEAMMRERRGRRIAMVFQEPLQALDPAMRVGAQLVEALTAHGIAGGEDARERSLTMLGRVGIADPRRAAERFPHEFSGGMRQRILIATALLAGPDLLIADEPTTALDATIQAQVLDLIDALRAETGTALLLISHDLDVVGERCDRIVVLDNGRVVEDAAAGEVIARPHSESGARLAAARRRRAPRGIAAPPAESIATVAPLLHVEGLSVSYRERRRRAGAVVVRAVADVSFQVAAGEAVGIVGESGCGKSSVAHALLRLTHATGQVRFAGEDLLALNGEALRRMRRRFQLVPQDAGASLSPHLTAESLVAEGLEVHGLAEGAEAAARARSLLAETGLSPDVARRRPHELSSGERQRVAIARALSTGPDLLVCDEPIAAVDAPTRERLLELFERLRTERRLALVFISHDLAAVGRIASRVLVMYLGHIVESGPASQVLGAPRMPYTQALLSAVPTGDPAARERRVVLHGEPPSPTATPAGCVFHPRCPHPAKDARCSTDSPVLRELTSAHDVACWKA